MLCLMDKCGERGALVTDGVPWADSDLYAAIGGDTSVTASCVAELLAKGVVSRREDGALYSRRMFRDEQVRQQRIKCGKLGGLAKSKQKPSKRLANPKQILYDSDSEYESDLSLGKGGVGGKPKVDLLAEAVRGTWAIQDIERVEALAGKFDSLGATPLEITIRRGRLRDLWGDKGDTPESLVKHWGKFGQETLTAIPGQPSKSDQERWLREQREHEAKVMAERKARRDAK